MAAQGLHGFAAAHGLHGLATAEGLHGLQGLHGLHGLHGKKAATQLTGITPVLTPAYTVPATPSPAAITIAVVFNSLLFTLLSYYFAKSELRVSLLEGYLQDVNQLRLPQRLQLWVITGPQTLART